jgi:hypothetical protein
MKNELLTGNEGDLVEFLNYYFGENSLESSRIETLEMLYGTKIETTDCFKTVAECI